MRTIFPNSRVIWAFALIVFTFIFLSIALSRISISSDEYLYRPIARDINSRTQWILEGITYNYSEFDISQAGALHAGPSGIIKANESPEDVLENKIRSEKVIDMVRHAWRGYHQFAWGANELSPIALKEKNQLIFGGRGMMATIIDAADTLLIMGLEEEYQQAHDRIRDHFNVSEVATAPLSVFEITIRHIGGLLSLFALTKENFYANKAAELARLLMPAFDTPTGIAKSFVDPKTNVSSNYIWAGGGSSILSEFGSLHMEFSYLSQITGDPIFSEKVHRIRDVLDRAYKKDGLYATYVAPETGTFVGGHVSAGALGDSFFELLLKSWLVSGKNDSQAYRMYKEASKAIRKKMVFTSAGGLVYVAELRNGFPEHKMSHLACFIVGMFALESLVEKNPRKKTELLHLAESLGHTCHESYRRSATGIGPEIFHFNFLSGEEATSYGADAGYILRPEAIEGWFYLWRLTGKKMYKDWVFHAVVAIDKYCRVEHGFAGLRNVYDPNEGYDDVQQTFFLAETMKYAYLVFNDDKFTFDEWIFNTEAHPFPVAHLI